MSEYRFSLTPRLVALAIFSGVALMVLLFALGYQVGQGLATPQAKAAASASVGNTAERAADDARRQISGRVNTEAAALTAPVSERLHATERAIR